MMMMPMIVGVEDAGDAVDVVAEDVDDDVKVDHVDVEDDVGTAVEDDVDLAPMLWHLRDYVGPSWALCWAFGPILGHDVGPSWALC